RDGALGRGVARRVGRRQDPGRAAGGDDAAGEGRCRAPVASLLRRNDAGAEGRVRADRRRVGRPDGPGRGRAPRQVTKRLAVASLGAWNAERSKTPPRARRTGPAVPRRGPSDRREPHLPGNRGSRRLPVPAPTTASDWAPLMKRKQATHSPVGPGGGTSVPRTYLSPGAAAPGATRRDRKSTRLNSSHT